MYLQETQSRPRKHFVGNILNQVQNKVGTSLNAVDFFGDAAI